MAKINVPQKYQIVWQKAVPYLKKGRKQDLAHCRQIAEEAYRLGKDRGWDLDVLIPTAIFHDIGHVAILPQHYPLITGPKKEENSKLVHMLTGAKIANDILAEIRYPKEKAKEIVEIISMHDKKDKSLFDTENKRNFHDLDRMDRFSDDIFRITKEEYGIGKKGTIELIEKEVLPDIISGEFRQIAEKRLKEMKK